MTSPVMIPETDQLVENDFSDKFPTRFDHNGNYVAYQEEILLWIHLITLSHSPVVVVRLQGEEKNRFENRR